MSRRAPPVTAFACLKAITCTNATPPDKAPGRGTVSRRMPGARP